MYVVIQTCGRQYRISKEDIITVDKMPGQAGDKVEISNVLLSSENGKVKIGAPKIEGAVVKAEIVKQFKEKKVIVFKKKRRKDYRKKQGHRQNLTNIKIKEILLK